MAENEIDLQEKFPDLQPIHGAPSLFTVNGCGLMLYGSRDYDRDTETYVKTQCLTFIFVPLLAVRAYRVANADQGWYFIGREPLSAFSRIWNVILAVTVMAGIGIGSWTAYTSSADYVARKDLQAADELAESGKWRDASDRYVKVINSKTPSVALARTRLDKLFADTADKADADDALKLIAHGERLRQQGIQIDGLEEIALQLASRHTEKHPRRSLEILRVVDKFPIVPEDKTAEVTKRRMKVRETVLVRLVAVEKDAVDAIAELAVIRETQGKLGECRKLLEPHLAKLGKTEGARVLGQIYARGGEIEKAHRLLVPYCKNRLTSLHQAEKRFREAYLLAENTVIEQLRKGNAPADLNNRVRNLSEDRRQAVLREYVDNQIREDVAVADARRALRKSARVVPVALDLGMVLLQRSRTLQDPAARQRELKQAEETFLAIQGMAGETEEYQLFLGQVYYWMGKQKQGRALFDKFLEKRKRSVQGLMMLAGTLRSLGATTEGRKLAEEAYQSASKPEDQHAAAGLRGLMYEDTDDQVLWLRRANPRSPRIQADLNGALGNQAERDGRNSDAAGFYHNAIDAYDKMPETAGSLNNGGLAWLALYRVTGEKTAFDNGVQRIEKAVALSPSDSLVLHNAASTLHEAAVADLIGKSINLPALQLSASLELLRHLYRDSKGRDAVMQRIRSHAGIKRSDELFNKVMLLAPKGPSPYYQAAVTRMFLRDEPGLKSLIEKLRAAQVDTAALEKRALDFIQGRNLEKTRRQTRTEIERLRSAIALLKGSRQTTFAVACARLSGHLIMLWKTGERVDAEEVVRLADDAHRAAPSSATRSALVSALAFRALHSLTGENAKKAVKHRRTVSTEDLLAAFIRHDSAVRSDLKQHPDVARIMALKKESGREFPGERSTSDWALMSRLDPDWAAECVPLIQRDTMRALSWQAIELIAPVHPDAALEAYWRLEMDGKAGEAAKIVDKYRKLGIELPLPKS